MSGTSKASDTEVVIVFSAPLPDVTARARAGNISHTAGALSVLREAYPELVYLHGGGALGASTHSNYDKGVHVIQLTNILKPDAYNVSRGDFAYGDDQISIRAREAAFPILSANIVDIETGQAADGVLPSVIVERSGVRIGIIGSTSTTLTDTFDVMYTSVTDPLAAVTQEVSHLRRQEVDLVVAILDTGSPSIADFREDGVQVDVILQVDPQEAAREHPQFSNDFFANPEAGEILLVELFNEENGWRAESRRLNQTDFPQDTVTLSLIEPITQRFDRILNIPVVRMDVLTNTTEPVIRTTESGFANIVADVLRQETNADIAIINSGQIRGARVYQYGEQITRKDIQAELPFVDAVVMLELTGQQVFDALEHGVSKVEELHGQFLQVSNLSYGYDPSAPTGQRITFVNHGGQRLDPQAVVKVAMPSFLADGGDGFTMFVDAPVLYKDQNLILWERVTNRLNEQTRVSFRTSGRIEIVQ